MKLTEKHCVPCEGGLPPLSEAAAKKYLAKIDSEWKLSESNKIIERTYTFDDFKDALNWVNKVGALAENEGHHPDIDIRYNKVTLHLTTHAIQGLSENDFILAAKIDVFNRKNQNS